MKYFLLILLFILSLTGKSANANEAIKCFEKAWEHTQMGGLGMTLGSARELCQKAN